MAKRTKRPSERYKLSGAAKAKLEKYISEIRKGITHVCELHTHDSAPSLAQADFETTFIDQILGQTSTAVSLSIKAFIDGLQAQKEAEIKVAAAQLTNQDEKPQKTKKTVKEE